MRSRLLAALCALLLASTAAAFSFEPRIVNGTVVAFDDSLDEPYYAVGVFPDGGLCGGSYIGDRKVITAAHCTEGASDVQVGFSEDGVMFLSGMGIHPNVLVVDAFLVREHPSYGDGSSVSNDIAIIYLKEDPPAFIQPIQVASSAQSRDIVQDLDTVTAYGWGTRYSDGPISARLREVDLTIDSMAACRSYYGSSTITGEMICAGASDTGDTCQGDSGGPLVFKGVSGPILVGITSFGDGCDEDGVPGAYTRASEFVDWINYMDLNSARFANFVVDSRIGNGSLGFGLLIILLGGLLVRRR